MGQTKTQFRWFTITQYKKEEEYLSEMHRQGWRITKVSLPGFYHFEKCEPENVVYCLDYNREGIENKVEYVQMFSDCGWEYLFDFVGYSYFRKSAEDGNVNADIFCDDESRLDMMKRVFKGRIIPMIIIFFFLILPQLLSNSVGYGSAPHGFQEVLSYCLLVLGIIYVLLFFVFAWQLYQYEKGMVTKKNIKYKYMGIVAGLIILLMTMFGIVIMANRSDYKIMEKENGFIIEAEQLNQSIVKELELKAGDVIVVKHTGDGGRLYMCIGKENEEPIFYGNTYDEFGEFQVTIEDPGVYQMKCTGKRSRGTVDIEIK